MRLDRGRHIHPVDLVAAGEIVGNVASALALTILLAPVGLFVPRSPFGWRPHRAGHLSSRARSAFSRCISSAARRASSTLCVPVRRSTFFCLLLSWLACLTLPLSTRPAFKNCSCKDAICAAPKIGSAGPDSGAGHWKNASVAKVGSTGPRSPSCWGSWPKSQHGPGYRQPESGQQSPLGWSVEDCTVDDMAVDGHVLLVRRRQPIVRAAAPAAS